MEQKGTKNSITMPFASKRMLAGDKELGGKDGLLARCVTKSKGAFSSETALLKLLYLTTQRILEKWKMPLAN